MSKPTQLPLLAISRRTRITPFHDRVVAAGVKAFTVYNHMLLPTVFESVEADYWHLRQHVQVWDVSCERQIEISGPDAFRLVRMMTPRDLGRIAVGQCMYAPLVDDAGGLINDPIVLRVGEDRFWISIADSDVLLWAKGLAHGHRLDVAIDEPDVFPLAVQGPKSDDLMARVVGEEIRSLKFYRWARFAFAGAELLIARSGWSRQGGFEIYLDDATLAEPLWDALFAAGGDLQVRAGCPNLIERIESGLLSYGNDMTRDETPLECGLERFCKIEQEFDFIGKAALKAQQAAGITRRLRGLVIDGRSAAPCLSPWPLKVEGLIVGDVRSLAFSPRLDSTIAVAMIAEDHAASGTKLALETPEGTVLQATVSDFPLISLKPEVAAAATASQIAPE